MSRTRSVLRSARRCSGCRLPHVPGGKPTQPASAHVGQSAEAGSFAKADDKVGRRLSDHHGCELTLGCSLCVVGRTNWQGARNQMMRPWDMLRREIRRIPYKLVLASSANFIGSLSYEREIYKIRRRGESFRANIWRAPAGSYFVVRSWTADERTVPKIKSQEAVRIPRNADPNALPDFARIRGPRVRAIEGLLGKDRAHRANDQPATPQ